MVHPRHAAAGAFVILASVAAGGCAAVLLAGAGAAAGVGTYKYVNGSLTSIEEASIDEVWAAARTAVAGLELATRSAAKDALTARLIAEQADGTDVKINLDRRGDRLTEVTIRVGFWGDEAAARLILDRIRAALGAASGA